MVDGEAAGAPEPDKDALSGVGWFFEWSPDDLAGTVIGVSDNPKDESWELLRKRYCPLRKNRPFERIVEIAIALGVTTVVTERRYIDLDYRSEHSHFYSTTFGRYPSVCHRLHFFTKAISYDLSDLDDAVASYRGYVVMRPLPSAPVGRTMLTPPPSVASAVLCLSIDKVHLLGRSLYVRAMPFVSQDREYLRCAHSSLWMMLYHSHLRHGMPRYLPHEIYEAALRGTPEGRRLPSDGITAGQAVVALQDLGMSSGHIRLPPTEAESAAHFSTSLFGILCRYVNSQMPPMVYSKHHSFIIAGYRVDDATVHDGGVTLIVHNDIEGPYLEVAECFFDTKSEPERVWKATIPPMPRKVYMTAERAETIGRVRLGQFAKISREGENRLNAVEDIGWRTYAVRSHEYKELARKRLPAELAELVCKSHMPRWVWVVEARNFSNGLGADVYGEVVIDATASHLAKPGDPVVILRHVDGDMSNFTPDFGDVNNVQLDSIAPYESGMASDDGQVPESSLRS